MPTTRRRLAAAMWQNRPSLPGWLLLAIVVLSVHVMTGIALPLFAVPTLLTVVAGTLQQSRAAVRAAAVEVEHAED